MVAEACVVHPSDNRGLRPDHEVALYEQIGRLIVAETDFYPISYRSDYAGVDYEAVMYDAGGCLEGVKIGPQADMAAFCNMWAGNLRVS